MKRILIIAFIALGMAYCNTPEPTVTDTPTTTGDTTTATDNRTDTGARRSDTLRLQK